MRVLNVQVSPYKESVKLRRISFLVLVVSVSLVVAACEQGPTTEPDLASTDSQADEDPDPDPTAPIGGDNGSSGFVVDGGLTIPEAIAYQGNQVVAVQGFVYRDGKTDALCKLLAESYPPQCGGASLGIVNPEATSEIVLTEANGVQWSETYVTFFGRISDGRLTIDSTVKG